MSSHCSRYPNCGCNSNCGTKCQLPEGDPRLLEKEIERNEMGYPLLADGTVDWELTSKEKEEFAFDVEAYKRRTDGVGRRTSSSKGKHPSNRTPPKKKRKK